MIAPKPHLQGVPPCPHGSFSPREGAERGMAPDEVLDFSASCNPLGPAPRVLEAIRGVDPYRYPDDETLALRRALANAFHAPLDWIAAGNGSVELIYHLTAAYLDPGDRAVVAGPTFGEYDRACRVAGGEVVEARAAEKDGFRHDSRMLASAIKQVEPKLAFLCNPNNPTGQVLSAGEVALVLEACERTLLVIDEAYLPFCDLAVDLRPYLRSGKLLLLRSLTKDHGLAGLRLGYALAPPELLEPLHRVRPPWTVNAAAQAAGLAALQEDDHVEAARRVVSESRTYLAEELTRLGLVVVPSAANFLLVRVGNGARFRSALLESGVCVRDCASFGLPAYVRIGVRTLPDCARLVESAREVLRDA